ncbi:MAG: hypoxanthine phosphoribosyltransferase [Bdellovibrionales bacterium]|nr:hypoxanthine phosphoribosyltransferase [Bdellovibrionales bacterium]
MPTSKHESGKSPKVLIPEVKLQARLTELAHEIAADYRGKEITAICILKGSFIFFADIIRKLDQPVVCEFLGVSSYGNRKVTSGEVKVTLDINEPLEGKHVIVFEDIVDSGLTLSYILNMIKTRQPASLRCCSLLMKPDSMKVDVDVDYVGFKIGNEFVIGYGLDYAGAYRGLPYIGYLEHDH